MTSKESFEKPISSLAAQTNVGPFRLSLQSTYSKFALLLLLITLVSLLPQYVDTLIHKPEAMSLPLFAHGLLFLFWYLLFFVQASLVSSGQFASHKLLGYCSIPLALVLILSGAHLLMGTMHSVQADWSEQHLFMRSSFVWAIFHTLVSFCSFYILAIVYRGQSAAHKRFMLLASLSMMSASITRFAYHPIIPMDGTAFTLLMTYALLLAPLLIDKWREGKVHKVFKIGVPVYLVTQLLAIAVLPGTEVGRALAFPF